MSLFTSPVTLNNGTDHVFQFRAQLMDKKAVVGEWVEPAADLASESRIIVKHDSSSATVRRRLLQRKVNRATTNRGLRPITVNLTVAYDVEHTSAQVDAEILLVKDALAEAGFVVNFLNGLV